MTTTSISASPRRIPAHPGDWRTVIAGSDAGLSARHHRLPRPSRDHRAGRRPRPDPAALLRRRRAPHPLRRGGLHGRARQQSRICAGRLSARATARWSPRRPSTTIIRPTNRLETLKVQRIPSGYDPEPLCHRADHGPARDGRRIPVSIVYRRGFERNGQGRLFLYAYGAYGYRHAAGVQHQPLLAARPRLRLRHRPYPRRRRVGLWLVSRRQARPSAPTPSTISSTSARGLIAERYTPRRPDRDPGPLGRRRADGRGGQFRRRNCGARWSPTCPSSTSSTPCSTRACR